MRATATVTGQGDVDDETISALFARKHDVKRVVYQSPRVALPTIAVGGVPISPSVQFTVTLHCSLAFGGPLVAHAGVEAKSQLRVGGVYENGAWERRFVRSSRSLRPSPWIAAERSKRAARWRSTRSSTRTAPRVS